MESTPEADVPIGTDRDRGGVRRLALPFVGLTAGVEVGQDAATHPPGSADADVVTRRATRLHARAKPGSRALDSGVHGQKTGTVGLHAPGWT